MKTEAILGTFRVVSVEDSGKPFFSSGTKPADKPDVPKQDAPKSKTVRLEPTESETSENNTFSKGKASGSIELTISNEEAYGFFVEGAEHNIKIYPAKK